MSQTAADLFYRLKRNARLKRALIDGDSEMSVGCQTGTIINKYRRHNKINKAARAFGGASPPSLAGRRALVNCAILSPLHCLLKCLLKIIDKESACEFCSR